MSFHLLSLLLLSAGCSLRAHASPAGAPIASSDLPSLSGTASTLDAPSQPAITSAAVLSDTNIASVPGAWTTYCNENIGLPCIVYCSATDTECQATANALVSACAPSWNSYWDVSRGFSPTGSGWHNVTSTGGHAARTVTTTVESYTSFTTANESFVKQDTSYHQTTITPVYALGSPVMVETVTTLGDSRATYTLLEGPMPTCSYISMNAMDREGCGKCTITGGTVDLFFWPSATSTGGAASITPMSTVIDGSTLVSPTVYIHLRTAFAADSCSVVGAQHTGTLIAVDAAQLSTQIHVGGKVAAYEYGQLDYADLTGLPPASEYQMQPSCVMFGCPTMYSTTWFPTLKVPPQIRSIDPAWDDCVLGLEGLYDPPIALQPREAAASATAAKPAEHSSPTPSRGQRPATPSATGRRTGRLDPTAPDMDPDDITSTSTVHRTALIMASTIVLSDYSATESTSTVHRTALILESTKVISVDYSDSSQTTRTHSNDPEAATALYDPTALSNGNGVLIGGHTLSVGDALTLGQDASKTTLSLITQASRETVLAFGTSEFIVLDPTEDVHISAPVSDLYWLPDGGYRIGSHTMAPGSAVTVKEKGHPVTYSMLTDGSTTMFAIGNTKTMTMLQSTVGASKANHGGFVFSQASSSGEIMLDGTTVLPGRPITVGSGADKTTLAITSVGTTPAVVIDGTTTEKPTRASSSTSSSLPWITQATEPSQTPSTSSSPDQSISTATDSQSAATTIRAEASVFLVAVGILLLLLAI